MNVPESAVARVERRHLEIKTFDSVLLIDPAILDRFYYQEDFLPAAQAMLHRFSVKVASKKIDSKEVIVPADWWQAVKLRFFPAWYLKRWPAKQIRHVLEANAYHPDVAIPKGRTFVDVNIVKFDQP